MAGDRAVIYDPETGGATVLNPTGSVLWSQLETPRNRAELEGCLQRRFGSIEPEVLKRDVEGFLNALVRAGLAVEVPSLAPAS